MVILMSTEIKTGEEKLIIHAFRDTYDDFPKGKLYKSESPDFILRLNPGNTIGIELTSLGKGPGKEVIPVSINDFIKSLHSIIALKEQKLPAYMKKRLNNYWLIITYDDAQVRIGGKLKDRLSGLIPGSNYNKIFLFDFLKGEIIYLKSG